VGCRSHRARRTLKALTLVSPCSESHLRRCCSAALDDVLMTLSRVEVGLDGTPRASGAGFLVVRQQRGAG
jgi:hypothetical protein